jgi:predicted kinase
MGLPLSGKTTWISRNIDLSKFLIISADVIKETHSEYKPSDSSGIHQWSVKIAENEMGRLSDSGYNLVMDGGGINNSYTIRIINMLKSKGYYVDLIHVKTPIDICLSRGSIRQRKIPMSDMIKKANKEESQFNKLVEITDNHVIIKNQKELAL